MNIVFNLILEELGDESIFTLTDGLHEWVLRRDDAWRSFSVRTFETPTRGCPVGKPKNRHLSKLWFLETHILFEFHVLKVSLTE